MVLFWIKVFQNDADKVYIRKGRGMPEFEWDETKNQTNIKERGIDFKTAEQIWLDPHMRVFAGYAGNDDVRYMALGTIDGRLHAAIFTLREKRIRLISVRIASRKERGLYEKK